MPKIYVITSKNGSVNWANTHFILTNSPKYFSDGYFDYGIGVEPYFTCPGCRRKLPVALAQLDHIKSQARYTQTTYGLAKTNGDFIVIDENLDRKTESVVSPVGGVVTIYPTKYLPGVPMHASVIWSNDLRNLQFICSGCNSSKGDKDWLAWKGTEDGTEPLSKVWKHTIPND